VTRATAQSPEEFDLDYAIEEDMPPGRPTRDSQYIFARMPRVVTEIAARPGERVLDVGCGFGGPVALLRQQGCEAWGLDASYDLAWYTRHRFLDEGCAPAVCGTAEQLPFRNGTFDRIICQGSLDHFAKPRSFMSEVARVLRPNGRAVIAISNYDSLSCRLGRNLYRMKDQRGVDVYRGRNYWQIPTNHTFKGTYNVLVRLGAPHLDLVECRGISMFWLFHRWTRLVETLPRFPAISLIAAADRLAYHVPQLADIVVSVWRPRSDGNGRR
jgi:SAM-dependent methyltransferase